MYRILLYTALITLFSPAHLYSQDSSNITKNIIYVGGGRQGVTYIRYERLVHYKSWTQTILNAGIGGMPGDEDYGEANTRMLNIEIGQLFGYKVMFAEIGLEPSLIFHGDLSYMDLNGVFGLRYQSRTKQLQGLFFHAGYFPRLYRTHVIDIDLPYYFGIGLNF